MRIIPRMLNSIYVHRLPVLLLILFLSAVFQIECTTLELNLNSNWRDREITIDGENSEWLGVMWYLEDENISVGWFNDDNYIYVCMIAENPLILAQVMGRGFTIWFDPDGGKEKTFGIKFPIGLQARGVPMGERERNERAKEPDPEKMQRAFKRSMAELEILGPGKDDQRRLLVKKAKGINVKLETSGEMFVYELKVPLLHSEPHPYAVGANVGDVIGIGLEIPKMDREKMRGEMGDEKGRGGGMPGGGRMGGRAGGMGMRGDRRPRIPEGLKVWFAVQIASQSKK